MLKNFRIASLLLAIPLFSGCATLEPMKTVDYVDLNRFMGDWYVIANIPTFLEKGAHNAVESYELNDAGEIETTFRFRAGSFDGSLKEYHPKGFVKDEESNALWDMQFIWPFRADYRIIYLAEDYSQVIIGRQARDYVWVMARTPEISNEDYSAMADRVAAFGYDVQELVKVPQQWPVSE